MQVQGRDRLVMVLRPVVAGSACPMCRGTSRRVHSWYRRRLSDLPWEGIAVRIELRVRRFFCDAEGCGQRIFTERLPETAPRYARRTSRLSVALEQITLALGGAAGSRLAAQLGILTNGSTLLRQLRHRLVVVRRQNSICPKLHLLLTVRGTNSELVFGVNGGVSGRVRTCRRSRILKRAQQNAQQFNGRHCLASTISQ